MITILTTGSRGDVQPYLALGIELKRAGYEVQTSLNKNHVKTLDQAGFIIDNIEDILPHTYTMELTKKLVDLVNQRG